MQLISFMCLFRQQKKYASWLNIGVSLVDVIVIL
jgi:hypothetical protein